jgi:hypothetical protein
MACESVCVKGAWRQRVRLRSPARPTTGPEFAGAARLRPIGHRALFPLPVPSICLGLSCLFQHFSEPAAAIQRLVSSLDLMLVAEVSGEFPRFHPSLGRHRVNDAAHIVPIIFDECARPADFDLVGMDLQRKAQAPSGQSAIDCAPPLCIVWIGRYERQRGVPGETSVRMGFFSVVPRDKVQAGSSVGFQCHREAHRHIGCVGLLLILVPIESQTTLHDSRADTGTDYRCYS